MPAGLVWKQRKGWHGQTGNILGRLLGILHHLFPHVKKTGKVLLMVQKSQTNHLGCIPNPVNNGIAAIFSASPFTTPTLRFPPVQTSPNLTVLHVTPGVQKVNASKEPEVWEKGAPKKPTSKTRHMVKHPIFMGKLHVLQIVVERRPLFETHTLKQNQKGRVVWFTSF